MFSLPLLQVFHFTKTTFNDIEDNVSLISVLGATQFGVWVELVFGGKFAKTNLQSITKTRSEYSVATSVNLVIQI